MSDFKTNGNGGRKHIGGKRFNHHVPQGYVLDLADHMAKMNAPSEAFPEGKYPHGNWKLGLTEADCLDSIERHNNAIKRGEYIDAETGSPHIIAIAANAMMFHELSKIGRLDMTGDQVFIERINNELGKVKK